jgi:hypothetical protein
MAKKKRTATMEDPTMEAIAGGHFRFATLQQAVSLLDRIGKQCIIASKQDRIEADKPPTLRLWIRGYDLTEEEKKEGYRGHYARIAIERIEGGRYRLVAEKMPVELKFHPQKERPKFQHPNWGHPILRCVLKNQKHATIEAARNELIRLHEEFPETTIPGTDKLHLMIFSRKTNPPIQRITLRLAANADGTFRIEHFEQQKKKSAPVPQAVNENTAENPAGKFTSLVSLQRKKKKK